MAAMALKKRRIGIGKICFHVRANTSLLVLIMDTVSNNTTTLHNIYLYILFPTTFLQKFARLQMSIYSHLQYVKYPG